MLAWGHLAILVREKNMIKVVVNVHHFSNYFDDVLTFHCFIVQEVLLESEHIY